MGKHVVIRKTNIRFLPLEDQTVVTVNVYWKHGEIWTCDSWDMQVDKYTHPNTPLPCQGQ